MDIEYFKPINLRITTVQENGYTVSWDVSPEALSEIEAKRAKPSFNVYVKDATTSLDSILYVISSSIGSYTTFIPAGYSEVYIKATDGTTESTASNSVILLSTNAMPASSAVAIGKDDEGIARSLSVTSDGVLRVTGATVNNYGGDASAANQTTAINKLDGIISAVNDVETATQNVLSGLNNVSLAAGTVSALQTVSINNLPSNYPDVDTTSAVNNLTTVLAKDATAIQIRDNVNGVLKTADLALNMGVLATNVNNMPTDFPDSALLSETVAQHAVISNIETESIATNTKLDSVNTSLGSLNVTNNSILTEQTNANVKLDDLNTGIASLNLAATSINNAALSIQTNTATIATSVAGALQTSDLSLNSGILDVAVTNNPADYPDSATHSKLDSIDQHIIDLTNGQTITFGESLPSGGNLIGRVGVETIPLAQNAATETSQQTIIQRIASATSAINTSNATLSNIKNTVTQIYTDMTAKAQNIICDLVISYNGTYDFRPEATVDPTLLENYKEYVLQIFSYDDAPSKFSLFRESAINSNVYYHRLGKYQQVGLFVNSVFEEKFSLMKNIMIRLNSNTSVKVRVRITGIK